jgi:hypothetical protein
LTRNCRPCAAIGAQVSAVQSEEIESDVAGAPRASKKLVELWSAGTGGAEIDTEERGRLRMTKSKPRARSPIIERLALHSRSD